jgi:hypothetical protein|tara:strand:+ start:1450 stop:1872 length:423 start_codon:yes stop_codon:yes gene_type:complete
VRWRDPRGCFGIGAACGDCRGRFGAILFQSGAVFDGAGDQNGLSFGWAFSSKGAIERDLTGDGRKDLVLAHGGVTCKGSNNISRRCGMQVCRVKLFVRQGQLLKLKSDFGWWGHFGANECTRNLRLRPWWRAMGDPMERT